MATTKFYLRVQRKDVPDAARRIYLYLTYAPKKRLVYPTGQKVKAERWDTDTQRVKVRAAGASTINTALDNMKTAADRLLDNMKRNRAADYEKATRDRMTRMEAGEPAGPIVEFQPITKSQIREAMDRRFKGVATEAEPMTLHKFVQERLDLKSADSKKAGTNSYRVYDNLKNQYLSYYEDRKSRKKREADFHNMNLVFFEDFVRFLRSQPANSNRHGRAASTLSDGYIKKLVTEFKSLLRTAVKLEYTGKTVFESIKPKDLKLTGSKTIEDLYLHYPELLALIELDLTGKSKTMQVVRDAFVVNCVAGLRVSDWKKLSIKKPSNVVGNLRFQFVKTTKSQEVKEAYVPLPELSVELLKRQGGSFEKFNPNTANRTLKKIAELAGLDRQVEGVPLSQAISTHVARQTCISNFRDVGTPQDLLDLITTHGKKKVTITDKYDRRSIEVKGKDLPLYVQKYMNRIFPTDAAILKIA